MSKTLKVPKINIQNRVILTQIQLAMCKVESSDCHKITCRECMLYYKNREEFKEFINDKLRT